MKQGIFSWVMGSVNGLIGSMAARQMQTVAFEPVAHAKNGGEHLMTKRWEKYKTSFLYRCRTSDGCHMDVYNPEIMISKSH
jgi:hypothetical protein